MYTGLTKEICATAWDIVQPSVDRASNTFVTNRDAGTIIVLDPWTGEVLFLDRVNEDHPECERFDRIAFQKARDCWKTGVCGSELQQLAPHLFRPGMTKWSGAVIQDRLAVSFSGVQECFDEAFAWMVLKLIVALCKNEMKKPDGVMASESAFIPEPTESRARSALARTALKLDGLRD